MSLIKNIIFGVVKHVGVLGKSVLVIHHLRKVLLKSDLYGHE